MILKVDHDKPITQIHHMTFFNPTYHQSFLKHILKTWVASGEVFLSLWSSDCDSGGVSTQLHQEEKGAKKWQEKSVLNDDRGKRSMRQLFAEQRLTDRRQSLCLTSEACVSQQI